MTTASTHQFDTLALHAGAAPDPATGARATPIYQTTSFVFRTRDHAAALFNMERAGPRLLAHLQSDHARCSRSASPRSKAASARSRRRAARRRCTWRSSRCWAPARTSSPRARSTAARTTCSHYTLPRFGIDDDVRRSARPRRAGAPRSGPKRACCSARRSAIPGLDVLDIPRVAALAHEHGLPLLVDSTFTTPWLMRPFEHGADLVLHSATKFLSGHGIVIGGLLVDGGQLRLGRRRGAASFPTLTEPYARLPRHGVHRGVDRRRRSCCARGARACATSARAWRRRRRSRSCRASRRCRCAWRATSTTRARWSSSSRAHPLVARVGYPELPTHPDHALAQRLLPRGCGAVFSFDLRGTREQGRALHRGAAALLAPRQRRRRQVAGDPSRRPPRTSAWTTRRSPRAGISRRHDPAVDRPRGCRRPDRRPDARAEGARGQGALTRCSSTSHGHEAYATPAASPFDRGAADASCSSTAPRTTTASGCCSRATSRTTAATCSRSTCRATAAAPGAALASVEAIADWLRDVLDAAGLARSGLVGHSLGSLAALECAARHPERVRRLALLGPAVPMAVSDELLAAAAAQRPRRLRAHQRLVVQRRSQLGGNQRARHVDDRQRDATARA